VAELLIYIVPSVLLLIVGFLAGRAIARKHRIDLDRREQQVAHLRVTDLRDHDAAMLGDRPARMVISEVTLGADYFISLLARLRNLIGGNVGVFEELLLRARREALMRLREQAVAEGYTGLANVRMEFADISGNAMSKQKAVMVTILAHATAYHVAPSESPADGAPTGG